MTRRPLPWILAMAAVFVAGLLAYIAWPREPEPPPAYPAQGAPLVRPHAPMLGPVDAPVTIVEFFDPSCEGCRAFHPYVKQIVADYRGKVRVVVRYAPLHQGSDEAVAILEAAREQARFEPVLEALLLRQPEWAVHGAPDLALAWRVAAEAGLDVLACAPTVGDGARTRGAGAGRRRPQCPRDREDAAFFVNGRPMTRFPPDELQAMVERQLAASR